MKNRLSLLAVFALNCFLFISCTKEDSMTASDNTTVVASASIDAVNELDVQLGVQISSEKLTARNTEKSLITSCATVTMDPITTTFPKTFYVDFGNWLQYKRHYP
jgi:hypothetical protein